MPVIKPITDLRNTNETSELCHKQQQPVFITKNGYGDLVVMSMETYDELLSTNHIDKAKAGFSDPKSAIYNAWEKTWLLNTTSVRFKNKSVERKGYLWKKDGKNKALKNLTLVGFLG